MDAAELLGLSFRNLHKWTWDEVLNLWAGYYKRKDPSLTEEQAIDKAKALIKARIKPHIPEL